MRTLLFSLLALAVGSSVALADKGYHAVPAESATHAEAAPAAAAVPTPNTPNAPNAPGAVRAENSGLDLRVVSYDGSVNGELTVEVKNLTKSARTFTATGLYFVPDGKADEAPQRLGAVGPMQIANDQSPQPKRLDKLDIPANSSMTVKLDVFCIDSHRSAPTSQNSFTLGTKRLPAKLRSTIETRSKAAADEVGGYAAPAAKSVMQSKVWEARDAEWVKIDGEGKQEVSKQGGRPAPQPPRHPRIKRPEPELQSVEPVQERQFAQPPAN